MFSYEILHIDTPGLSDQYTSVMCRYWMQSRGPAKSERQLVWRQEREREREREREKERESRSPCLQPNLMRCLYIYIYIYIYIYMCVCVCVCVCKVIMCLPNNIQPRLRYIAGLFIGSCIYFHLTNNSPFIFITGSKISIFLSIRCGT